MVIENQQGGMEGVDDLRRVAVSRKWTRRNTSWQASKNEYGTPKFDWWLIPQNQSEVQIAEAWAGGPIHCEQVHKSHRNDELQRFVIYLFYFFCPVNFIFPRNLLTNVHFFLTAIIDIDGNNWSSPFEMLLCSNSVIVKVSIDLIFLEFTFMPILFSEAVRAMFRWILTT